MKTQEIRLLLSAKGGTAIQTISGKAFPENPYDQRLIPGYAESLKQYANIPIYLVSNQGGLGAGFKSLEDTYEEMWHAISLIRQATGIQVKGAIFCPGTSAQDSSKFERTLVLGQSYIPSAEVPPNLCLHVGRY